MSFLLVLEGIHAGATVELVAGRYSVQSGSYTLVSNSDPTVTIITLFDWSGVALDLWVTSDGSVFKVNGDGPSDPLLDKPWILGEHLIRGCVRLSLSQKVYQTPINVDKEKLDLIDLPVLNDRFLQPGGRTYSWSARAYCVGASLLVAVTALYGHTGNDGQGPIMRMDLDQTSFSNLLRQRGLGEIAVDRTSGAIVLSGMVRNVEQGRIARQIVNEYVGTSHFPVLIQWEVADDIESTVEAAIGKPGVRVKYMTDGRFRIEGNVDDPKLVESSADRLLKDLGANVSRFDFALETIKHEHEVNSAISAGRLIYSERHDGAKVFINNSDGI